MPALTAKQDEQITLTPTEELLSLDLLQPENIRDTLHAYQLAKRCNEKRVMAQAVEWGKRGARLNDIAPGIVVTPLAIDEFNGKLFLRSSQALIQCDNICASYPLHLLRSDPKMGLECLDFGVGADI